VSGIWVGSGIAGAAAWLVDGLGSGAAWAVRLVTKCLDLIGFGEIVDLLGVVFRGATRELTPAETFEVHKVFLDNIDYGQVRIYENSLLADFGAWLYTFKTMGVTTFHTINTNRPISFAPGSWDTGWLVHELTHVWQYEHFGGQYLVEAAWAQASAGYDYGVDDNLRNAANGTALAAKRRDANATFASFNREQQGAIVQHYYMRSSNGYDHSAWDPYIDELRSGIG
jgi:hypothetical protein